MKECANCDFHIEGVCVCPPYDKWYACSIENKKPENIQALKEYGESRTIEQVFVRAEVVGILPSGQKRVHLLADGADGIEFVTNENSLVKVGRLTTEPQIVRCKDCKHQEKHFYADKRRKDGGMYIYGCDLADRYSHVCLDDDFCSRGERKDG